MVAEVKMGDVLGRGKHEWLPVPTGVMLLLKRSSTHADAQRHKRDAFAIHDHALTTR